MAVPKNHPSYWGNADAVASLDRYEDDHGKINLTDFGRTQEFQQSLINRWYKGGAANRPPYLFKPYEPAAEGPHVVGGGLALDTTDYVRFSQLSAEYGWIHNLPSSDPVHFIYDINRDQHRGRGTAPAGTAVRNEAVAQRQNFLNQARGEKLTVDGIDGPATKAAISRYQTFLRGYGYTGAIDGIWGTNTQIAHNAYWAALNAPKTAPAATPAVIKDRQTFLVLKRGEKLAVDGVNGPATKAAIARYQEFLRNYGYTGSIDGLWGNGTQTAHEKYYAALGLH